ncbi:MAG TPA: NYN domain-containing protein [Candidatus Glassbacteria bacterium]|nr:NYN domain-containing protein [Candidatus Glassbacteria bacterium]
MDLPNLYQSICRKEARMDARQVLSEIREKFGKPVISNAYAFFRRIPEPVQAHLMNLNVALIQCPAYQGGLPTTDSVMAAEIYEVLYSRRVDTFVIGSGDGDFAPLACAIRARGRRAVALAEKNSLSRRLRDAVDEVIFWPAATASSAPVSRPAACPAPRAGKAVPV